MENVSTNPVENTSDNSENTELSLQDEIDKVFDEPDENQQNEDEPADGNEQEPPAESKTEDNSINCPEKFINEDGSINVKNLAKSYTELEPLVNEKAKWETERAELLSYKNQLDEINKQREQEAKSAGYDSALDMQQSYQVAQYEAKEYMKYLQYLDDETRQTVQGLLYQYANNPSEALMQQIEVEFAPEINKRIAIQSDRMKRQFEIDKQAKEQTMQMSNIEGIISKSVDEHSDVFKYEPFKNLFVNALHKFGDRFTYEDAEALINTVTELKKSFQEEFSSASDASKANKEATDKLANITGQSSAPASSAQPEKININTISDAELDKYIAKYI